MDVVDIVQLDLVKLLLLGFIIISGTKVFRSSPVSSLRRRRRQRGLGLGLGEFPLGCLVDIGSVGRVSWRRHGGRRTHGALDP